MKASSKICKGIKALLSQLQSEVSVKSKNRLIPKKCVTCFSSRPFGKLEKLSAEAFSGLLNHFYITVPDSIEKEIAAVRFNPSSGTNVGEFCKYIQPTGPIPQQG